MLLHPGTQERLISESTTGAGSSSKEGSIQSDSLLATLWVGSVTSGTLTVSVYTLTDTGKEVLLFSFPAISAPTSNLLLKKAGVSLQRFRVEATYTGVCNYEVYIRATEGIGESSNKILGADTWKVSQSTVTTVAAVLIPASLTDRNGLVLKNWSPTGNIFVAESLAKATAALGYPLAPKDALALDVAAGAAIYAIADAASVDVRIAESGG